MSQQPRRAQSDGVSSGGKSGSNYSCAPRQIWSGCVLPEVGYTSQNLAASSFSALAWLSKRKPWSSWSSCRATGSNKVHRQCPGH